MGLIKGGAVRGASRVGRGVQMRDVRDPRGQGLLPVLTRLAALTDENDEMRSYFIATGGGPRLTQLTESAQSPLKSAPPTPPGPRSPAKPSPPPHLPPLSCPCLAARPVLGHVPGAPTRM